MNDVSADVPYHSENEEGELDFLRQTVQKE